MWENIVQYTNNNTYINIKTINMNAQCSYCACARGGWVVVTSISPTKSYIISNISFISYIYKYSCMHALTPCVFFSIRIKCTYHEFRWPTRSIVRSHTLTRWKCKNERHLLALRCVFSVVVVFGEHERRAFASYCSWPN